MGPGIFTRRVQSGSRRQPPASRFLGRGGRHPWAPEAPGCVWEACGACFLQKCESCTLGKVEAAWPLAGLVILDSKRTARDRFPVWSVPTGTSPRHAETHVSCCFTLSHSTRPAVTRKPWSLRCSGLWLGPQAKRQESGVAGISASSSPLRRGPQPRLPLWAPAKSQLTALPQSCLLSRFSSIRPVMALLKCPLPLELSVANTWGFSPWLCSRTGAAL